MNAAEQRETPPARPDAGPDLKAVWRSYLAALARDLLRLRERPSDEFPHFGKGGRWTWLSVDRLSSWGQDGTYEHGNWTAGFTLGSLALLENATSGSVERELWDSRAAAVAKRANDTTTHDLGFLFFPGHVFGSHLGTFGPPAGDRALKSAATLAKRFNEAGQYIQAFGEIGDPRSAGTTTIDTMMNLPLLWWASSETGELYFHDVALRHARMSARLFLREDGSTFHLLHLDPLSGNILRRGTFQGASDDSCWSRGQAWGVAGFAWAHAVSADHELLHAARATADAFWRMLPPDGIPPWDFSAGAESTARDASAGAIAALGSLILAETDPDRDLRAVYRRRAERMLVVLGTCISPSAEGALQESCYSLPAGLGTNGAVAWGDFYFGLALALAVGEIDLPTLFVHSPEQIRATDKNGGSS